MGEFLNQLFCYPINWLIAKQKLTFFSNVCTKMFFDKIVQFSVTFRWIVFIHRNLLKSNISLLYLLFLNPGPWQPLLYLFFLNPGPWQPLLFLLFLNPGPWQREINFSVIFIIYKSRPRALATGNKWIFKFSDLKYKINW